MRTYQLILSSGFSTADQLSDVSGREVGLDVVRNKIESLGGKVDITSEPDKGSNFTIELPLTLSILSTLLVNVQSEIYGVPLSSIIINLRRRLNLDKVDYTESTRILIVRLNHLQVGLIVDSATDVIDIDQAEIESAPDILHKVDKFFLKGVAKLGNELLLLLNLENVLNTEEIHEVKEVVK